MLKVSVLRNYPLVLQDSQLQIKVYISRRKISKIKEEKILNLLEIIQMQDFLRGGYFTVRAKSRLRDTITQT